MTEQEQAVELANRVLDRRSADPDDDLAVLARQFLRAHERSTFTRPDCSLPYSITRCWDWSRLIPQGSVLVVHGSTEEIDVFVHGKSARWNNGAGLEKIRDDSWVNDALRAALNRREHCVNGQQPPE